MSRMLGLIIVLGAASSLFAAPNERAPSKEAQEVGERFGRDLGVIADMIHREYVRPIPTNELYEASLIAIHDAARQPRPDSLLRELRAAKDESTRLAIVKRARAALHGSPALADGLDLFIAVNAFTAKLDPHSVLVSGASINGTTTARIFGFELEGEAQPRPTPRKAAGGPFAPPPDEDDYRSGMPTLPFRVMSVKPGSPAQKAGLRPGDIIREIQGIAAEGNKAGLAYGYLHGAGVDSADPGAQSLAIDRAGYREPLKLKLERTEYRTEAIFGVTRKSDNSWNYWLDAEKRIAYVRLAFIESDSGELLQEILHDLRDIRGLVFDLRWCPGGYIDAATQVASTFLESGIVAKMKYRNPNRGEDSVIHADGGLVKYKAGDYPVLLLVNGETTGGGELIAAALRDNDRAKLAGSRTFGKATIQWPINLPGLPGYQLKLTGGTYSRPNGKPMQRFPDSKLSDEWGLKPDAGFEIPMSADLSKQLKEMHMLYTLRPGGSREAHELDDPAADPQRARALKLMRKTLEQKKD